MAIRISRGPPAGKRRKLRGEHGGRPEVRYPSRLGRRPFGSALLPNTDQSKSEVYYPVTTTTTAPPSPWVEYIGTTTSGPPHHTNSHWTGALDLYWDGAAWQNYFGNNGLGEVGVWNVAFRPSKIRVAYTDVVLIDLRLYDKNGNIIAQDAAYVSGVELDITFVEPHDINYLAFVGATAAQVVTSIEFLP